MKTGYPPKSLTIVPELPAASLGLKSGEQIIVNEIAGSSVTITSPPPARTSNDISSLPSEQLVSARPLAPSNTSGPHFVETEGGILIHRVSGTILA